MNDHGKIGYRYQALNHDLRIDKHNDQRELGKEEVRAAWSNKVVKIN